MSQALSARLRVGHAEKKVGTNFKPHQKLDSGIVTSSDAHVLGVIYFRQRSKFAFKILSP